MHSKPPAGWSTDVKLVAALLEDQMPHLPRSAICSLGSGWDNDMYRVDDVVVRLPRRQVAVELLENEGRWLPTLGPLSLPVPTPLHIGKPSARFPHPWLVYPYFPGRPLLESAPSRPRHSAALLGEFLAGLHKPAPQNAPVSPFRGVPLASRSERMEKYLQALGSRVDASLIRARWNASLRLPVAEGPRLWLHGDLHPSNIIVHGGDISAIVDFGDICAGDRAGDLSIAWMVFDEGEREVFRESAQVDDATWLRSQGWALTLGVLYAATSLHDASFHSMALRTIERATCEEPGKPL